MTSDNSKDRRMTASSDSIEYLSIPEEPLSPAKPVISSFSIFKSIFSGSAKLSISFFLEFSTRSVALIFLQSDTPTVQAAVALGGSIYGILSWAILVGMNTGLMCRLSHAYGQGNNKLMGLYLHRGFLLNLMYVLFTSVLVYFSPLVFTHFGYDAKMLNCMKDYIHLSLLSFPGYAICQLINNYLNAGKIFHVSPLIQAFSCVSYFIAAYCFIIRLNMGYVGAAYSLIIQQSLAAVLLVLYCKIKDPIPGTWLKFQKKSFIGLWDLFKYQVVTGSMIYLEWAGYEVLVLFSGILPVPMVAALMICLNFECLLSSVGLSISLTNSSYMGNFMGERKVCLAMRYLKMSFWVSLMLSLVLDSGIFFLKEQLAEMYSSDKETKGYIKELLNYVCLMIPLDFLQNLLSGAMRTIGKEKQGSMILIVNLYFIGLPFGVALVLWTGLQVYAIMMTFLLYMSMDVLCYSFVLCRSNWYKQSKVICVGLLKDAPSP